MIAGKTNSNGSDWDPLYSIPKQLHQKSPNIFGYRDTEVRLLLVQVSALPLGPLGQDTTLD